MTSFGLIGAAALVLLVATPAMAAQRVGHHRYVSVRHGQNYRSFYGAYGFDRGNDSSSGDFDRRNTFN